MAIRRTLAEFSDNIATADIADNAVTAAKMADDAILPASIAYLGDGTGNLSGTITGQQLRLGTAFTLTDDLTVNGDLTLSKVRADGTGQSLTQDSSANRTLTGTGTLRMGSVVQKTSISGFSGVLDSGVTGGAGLNEVSGILLRTTYITAAGSGTWTKPSDTVSVRIIVIGGGGGGGGATAANGSGGGGGAGGTAEKYIAVSAASYDWVVGAAGLGGATGVSGAIGGDTTIAEAGGAVFLTGGTGGYGGWPSAGAGGGLAGTASGGDINTPGGGGIGGSNSATANGAGGAGGNSTRGGGARGIWAGGAGWYGATGTGGGGGGAGKGAFAGGYAGTGYIEIKEYS